MKFIRNGRIRDRIIDTLAKGLLIAFSALVCLWMISGARAAGTDIQDIRQEAREDGTYEVEFVLSKSIAKEDVAVEFQRNFIQVSLKGVSAYPARTESLHHAFMEKVFTYQYQPDLARARLLLKGQASSVKAGSSWSVDGQVVKINVGGNGGSVATVRKDQIKTKAAAPTGREIAIAVDPAEQKVRDEIMLAAKGGDKTATTAANTVKTATVDHESLPVFGRTAAEASLGAKDKESPATKIFTSLLLVVGVIGAGALGYRRFAQGKGGVFTRSGKMIEVLSTQSMGPKRSIAVIKVLDQHMVVGMSGDSMTLLTNLGTDVNLDRYAEELPLGASFTDTLQGAITSGTNRSAAKVATPQSNNGDAGFRASLKKRLEGFKPL